MSTRRRTLNAIGLALLLVGCASIAFIFHTISGGKTNGDDQQLFAVAEIEKSGGKVRKLQNEQGASYTAVHYRIATSESLDALRFLSAIPDLEELWLNLSDPRLSVPGYVSDKWTFGFAREELRDKLLVLREIPRLRRLKFAAEFDDDLVQQCRYATALTHLDVSSTKVSGAFLRELGGLTELRHIDLSYTKRFSDEELKHVGNLKALRSLTLERSNAGNDAIAHLRDSATIEELNLGYSNVTEEGLEHLSMLVRLRRLELGDVIRSDNGLRHLSTLSALENLRIHDKPAITDEGLKWLARMSGIKELALGDLKISDGGIVHLQNMKKLRELWLFRTEITGKNMSFLEGMHDLRELHLSGTKFNDAGLSHVSKVASLEELDLEGTDVTDVGIAHLANLQRLRKLSLRNTRITDEGLKELSSLQDLDELVLLETDVTDDGISKFLTRVPRLHRHSAGFKILWSKSYLETAP